jgi:leucyl/phenylalanyl-tRNA--protein transferase
MTSETLSLGAPAGHSRRDEIFRETTFERLRRCTLGTAWGLMPARFGGVPDVLRAVARDWLARTDTLPDAASAPLSGIAGIAHDLSVERLREAYSRGLYPLAHAGPIKWHSPPQRSLLFFPDLHIAKRLRRQMRQGRYAVTFDQDIEAVLKACAGVRTGRLPLTWITPRVMRAYADAFDAGLAHSFEVWNERGELAGGGYGVALGGVFSTESQFSAEPNTSKIGFTVLNYHLARWGFAFNDGKLFTPTTRDMGFKEIPRRDYLAGLAEAASLPGKPGRWSVEADVTAIADWQPKIPQRTMRKLPPG